MPYPTVDWGQNLIEGLRTGAYMRSLREQAMQERMLADLKRRQLEMEAPAYEALAGQRRASGEASQAMAELRRGPQSRYWEKYGELRSAQKEVELDSPTLRADLAAKKNRADYEKAIAVAKIRGSSGSLGSPDIQLLRLLLGKPEEGREEVIDLLGDVYGAKGGGKTGGGFQTTFKGDLPDTDLYNEIERYSGLPFSEWPPEVYKLIADYRAEEDHYRRQAKMPKPVMPNEEGYVAPPSREDLFLAIDAAIRNSREASKARMRDAESTEPQRYGYIPR